MERVLHGGTAGVADEAFYARVRAYLLRAGAPTLARAAVDFAHGLAAWSFAEASRAGGTLIDAFRRDSVTWVPVSQLRNGTAVARLRLGDSAGATAAFRALAGLGDEGDFVASLGELRCHVSAYPARTKDCDAHCDLLRETRADHPFSLQPNARFQARLAAGARDERTLAAVACNPFIGRLSCFQ